MYTNKLFKKWVAPVSLAGLLLTSQLSASLIANAEENNQVTHIENNLIGKDIPYKNMLNNVNTFLLSITPNPKLGNEDTIINLARSSYPVASNYYQSYYQDITQKLDKNKGTLPTSYGGIGKVILALTAAGYNAEDIKGYNLISIMLDSYINELNKGDKGAIYYSSTLYILLALDSIDYQIPSDEKYNNITRESLVENLIQSQNENGGFAYTDGIEPSNDTTAMIITALAPYASQNENVKASIAKGFSFLKNNLTENAGLNGFYGTESSDSIAQLLISLTSTNTNPQSDSSFVKANKEWSLSNLVKFADSKTGGFKSGLSEKDANQWSSNGASLALASYERFKEGPNLIFDMSDADTSKLTFDKKAPAKPTVNTVADNKTVITGKTEAYATITVRTGSKVIGTAQANFKGSYSVNIKRQKAGTTLNIVATDLGKNKSKTISLKVVDKTAPKAPKVNKVTKHSTKITGSAEAKAKVYIFKNKKLYKTGVVSSKGKFSISIKKQKVGTKFTVYVRDKAKNMSTSKKISVKSK